MTKNKKTPNKEILHSIEKIIKCYYKMYNIKIENNQSISPERIERMMTNELFVGLDKKREPRIEYFFEKIKNNDEIKPVIVDNISIFSICEHHFLPFIGKATFKYLPNKVIKHNNNKMIAIIGLSKIPRMIDYLARKPQTQERLTMEIFDKFKEILKTDNISISITCEHLCAKIRGIKDDITMTTSKDGGIFNKKNI